MLDAHGAPLADAKVLLDELGRLRHVEHAHRGHVLGDASTASSISLLHDLIDKELPNRPY